MTGGTARGGHRPGRLVVVAGPSGVGKGTVVHRLLQLRPDLALSVSATTRAPRPREVEGRDYRFLSDAEFDALVAEGAFLEWARIFGHRSGTLRSAVEERLAAGRSVVLEIDVQGARQIRDAMPDALLIFLAAPSPTELERRLRSRLTERGEALAERLEKAPWETAQASWFDHVVVNDEVERAAREIAGIIPA